MYSIKFSPEASSTYRWLFKHDRVLFDRIYAVLENLKHDPFSGKPLKWELHGKYSYRVGSYRILYTIVKQQLIVCILDIGHRKEVYRRR